MEVDPPLSLAAVVWPDWCVQHTISCLSSSFNNNFLATGNVEGYLLLWARDSPQAVPVDVRQPSATSLTSSCNEIGHTKEFKPKFFLFSHWHGMPSVLDCTFAFSASSKLQGCSVEILLSLHGDNTIRVWSLQDGRCIDILRNVVHYNIKGIRAFEDRRFLLICGYSEVCVFDIWTKRLVCDLLLNRELISREKELKQTEGHMAAPDSDVKYGRGVRAKRDCYQDAKISDFAVSYSAITYQKIAAQLREQRRRGTRIRTRRAGGSERRSYGSVGSRVTQGGVRRKEGLDEDVFSRTKVDLKNYHKYKTEDFIERFSSDRYAFEKSDELNDVKAPIFSKSQFLVACVYTTGVLACWDVTAVMEQWVGKKVVCGSTNFMDAQRKGVTSREFVGHSASKEENANQIIGNIGKTEYFSPNAPSCDAVPTYSIDPIFVSDVHMGNDEGTTCENASRRIALSPNFLFLIAKERLIVWKRVDTTVFQPLVDIFCPQVSRNISTVHINSAESKEEIKLPCWIGIQIINSAKLDMIPGEAPPISFNAEIGREGNDVSMRSSLSFEDAYQSSIFSCAVVLWSSEGLVASYYFSSSATPATKPVIHLENIPRTVLENSYRRAPLIIADRTVSQKVGAASNNYTAASREDEIAAPIKESTTHPFINLFDVKFYCVDALKADELTMFQLTGNQTKDAAWVSKSIDEIWQMGHYQRKLLNGAFNSDSWIHSQPFTPEEEPPDDRSVVVVIFAFVEMKLFLIGAFSDGTIAALCFNDTRNEYRNGAILTRESAKIVEPVTSLVEEESGCTTSDVGTEHSAVYSSVLAPGAAWTTIADIQSPLHAHCGDACSIDGSYPLSSNSVNHRKADKRDGNYYTTIATIDNTLLVGGSIFGDVTLWSLPEFELLRHFSGFHVSAVDSIFRIRRLGSKRHSEKFGPCCFLSVDRSNHAVLCEATDVCFEHPEWNDEFDEGGIQMDVNITAPQSYREKSAIASALFDICRLAPHCECTVNEIQGAFMSQNADVVLIITVYSIFMWKAKSGIFMRQLSRNTMQGISSDAPLSIGFHALASDVLQAWELCDNNYHMEVNKGGVICGNISVTPCEHTDVFDVHQNKKESSELKGSGILAANPVNLSTKAASSSKTNFCHSSGSFPVVVLELNRFIEFITQTYNDKATIEAGGYSMNQIVKALPLCSLFFPYGLSSSTDRIAFKFLNFLSFINLPLTTAILGVGCSLSIPIPACGPPKVSEKETLFGGRMHNRISSIDPSQRRDTDLRVKAEQLLSVEQTQFYKTSSRPDRTHQLRFHWRSRNRQHSSPCEFRNPRWRSFMKGSQFREDAFLYTKHKSNVRWVNELCAQWPLSKATCTLQNGLDIMPSLILLKELVREERRWQSNASLLYTKLVEDYDAIESSAVPSTEFMHSITSTASSSHTNQRQNNDMQLTHSPSPLRRSMNHSLVFCQLQYPAYPRFGHTFWKSPYTFAALALFVDTIASFWLNGFAATASLYEELRETLITEILSAADSNGICLSLLSRLALQVTNDAKHKSAEYILRTCIRFAPEQYLRVYVKTSFSLLASATTPVTWEDSDASGGDEDLYNKEASTPKTVSVLHERGCSDGVTMLEVALLILSVVVYERPFHAKRLGTALVGEALRYLLWYHLHHKNYSRKAFLFCELLADGCEILWKPKIIRLQGIHEAFKSSINQSEIAAVMTYTACLPQKTDAALAEFILEIFNNYQLIYFSKPCTRILEAIARDEPGPLIQAMGFAARRPDKEVNYNTSALFLLLRLTKRAPSTMHHYLNDIAQVIVSCLDPSDITRRKKCLPAATSSLFQLVRHFPMIAFHQASQRLAVAGPCTFITLYDLRTATMWRILEGHKGIIDALDFSEDGNSLGSYSADENLFCVWRTAASGFLGGILGIAGTYEKSKSLEPLKRTRHWSPMFMNLRNVRVHCRAPSEWILRREDGRNYLLVLD